MFKIYDPETNTQTWIPKTHVDYLACDSDKCVIRYRNVCSPEVLKEYEKLLENEKYAWQSANMVLPRYRYAMPHLDRALDKARGIIESHNALHGCNGTLLIKIFPKGDPNYDRFSNALKRQ
jgi:hypothetical protein